MITEERLSEMLDAAADSYPVPPEGAERILGLANEPVTPPKQPVDYYEINRRRQRRKVAFGSGAAACVVGALIAAAVVTGGGGGGGRTSSSAEGRAASGTSSSSSGASSGQLAPLPDSAKSAPQGSAGVNQPAPTQPSQPGVQSRIIETGDASLQVRAGQVPAALTKLQSLATSLGGLVASSNSESGSTPNGSVTLRVPVAKFSDLMSRLPSIGSVVSSSSSTKDVTGQYVDLSARLKALTTTRDTYLTMLSKATTIGDTLAVESRIDGIQQQIEELQGQQQVLASQSDLATLNVDVSEKGAPVTAPTSNHRSGFTGAVHRAWDRFTGGLEAVIAASGVLALILIGCGLAYLGGRVLYRSVRRRMV